MTKAREAVLEALDAAASPLTAQGIGEKLSQCCDKATVYRALHYLEEKGLADSFVLHCEAHGTERYFASLKAQHRHWLHCELCHGFVDLGECHFEPILKEMEAASGARIKSHTLYATGICPVCGLATHEAADVQG
ncbi:MAG: transcriptional repressor [Spirochaetes bacterium]|nr:transcriptional repressor [Spirochaetota bacterium]